MKRNNGFTLVELLAVIAIMAIMVIIATQPVMNIINNANKNAFKDSVYGLLKAGESYYLNQQLSSTGMIENKTFTFPDDTELKISGSKPTGGTMVINKKGDISIAVINERYCVTKGYDEVELTITEDVNNCNNSAFIKKLVDLATTSNIVTEVHECATSGKCEVGTKFVIRVNENETHNFYVINDNETEVTLLMDKNLVEYLEQIPGQEEGIGGYRGVWVTWISEQDYGCGDLGEGCQKTDKGPITALNKLKELTSTWTNIPEKLYIISDDNSIPLYSNVKINSRARLLSYTEAITICGDGCDSDFIYSDILTDNFEGYDSDGDYWLSTSDSENSVKTIDYLGRPVYEYMFGSHQSYNGMALRPVITLTK